MDIGIPREIKNHEYRVGVTPSGARALIESGHRVFIESGAGARIGFSDAQYEKAGADIVATPQEVHACHLIVKVKELQPAEFRLTHPGQILFCYHHLAPDRELLQALLDARVTCIAYETVTEPGGTLPPLVHDADLVIGAVLLPGKLSPKLVRRSDIQRMRPGSAIVDVGIDQGGICETSRPTSHSDPLYVEDGVVHYCVTNMPAAVARTATLALTQATLPYALAFADKGLRRALTEDAGLLAGLQVHDGCVTHLGLAQDTRRPCTDPLRALGG